MSARLLTRPWRYILAVLTAALCLLVLVDQSLTLPSARAQPAQAAGDVVVTTCTPQGLADAMNSGSGMITFNCGGTLPDRQRRWSRDFQGHGAPDPGGDRRSWEEDAQLSCLGPVIDCPR